MAWPGKSYLGCKHKPPPSWFASPTHTLKLHVHGLQVIKDGDLYAAGGPLPLPVLVVCNGGEYLNRLSNPPPPEDADERRMLGESAPDLRMSTDSGLLCTPKHWGHAWPPYCFAI